ncbi:MAG: ABC transporter ATP-binding protein [Paludibacteraceae bacterium]|nr:ABC transporter ATP-binding protein [Paludibacteraceae bacterium]
MKQPTPYIPQLQLQHLAVGYGNQSVQTGLNLKAEAGTLICLLGKNGCGKSTLLRTLAGLQAPLEGSIRFAGYPDESACLDMQKLSQQQRAKLLALVLTERLSMDNTTVHDVVAMGRYPYSSFLGGLTDADENVISEALQQTRLEDKAAQFFNCLSDGEKQRVLIAKALAQQTPLILLDEPTAHLDLNNRIRTLLLLKQLAHTARKCVIISTHELDLALQTADTVWLMTPGQGVETGTPEELTASGAFQTAFQDDNFSFVAENGQLRIRLKP